MTIRPMTLKELAAIYGVSRSTMYRWIKPHRQEIGERKPGMHVYTARQVLTIFRILDPPEVLQSVSD